MSNALEKTAMQREDRLHDLFREWGQRTRAVHKLEAKISHNNKVSAKPSLITRLSQWLTQLIFLQHKERDTLSQICAIERQHKKMRIQKKVQRIKPEPIFEPNIEKKKKSNLWLWIVVFLLLRNKKKQRPLLVLQNG